MGRDAKGAERVTEIVSLLRPARPRRLPETLAGAASSGDIERLQLFLDRGTDLEQRSHWRTTALGTACAHGQIETVRWLLAHGAHPDVGDDTNSPIVLALSKADCPVAAVLLDAGLPIERAAWGAIVAATLGRVDMLHWLVGRGLDLDAGYPRLGVLRERALREATKAGRHDIVRFLDPTRDPGAAPTAPPPGPPPRADKPRAAEADRPRLLQEALELVRAAGKAAATWNATGPVAPPQRQSLLAFAAGTGLVPLVDALLDAGASPDRGPDGTPPPLSAAAGEAQVEVLARLLERGASPDGPDGRSWLPLESAAQSGEPEAVRRLLAAGANPKAKSATGRRLDDYVRGPYADEIRALIAAAPVKAPRARR